MLNVCILKYRDIQKLFHENVMRVTIREKIHIVVSNQRVRIFM